LTKGKRKAGQTENKEVRKQANKNIKGNGMGRKEGERKGKKAIYRTEDLIQLELKFKPVSERLW
jgi:hypothetical protein